MLPALRLTAAAWVVAATVGCGAPLEYRGRVAADARGFIEPPKYDGQAWGNTVSLLADPEIYLQSEGEAHTATLRPFARVDPADGARTHYDLRQADYRLATGVIEAGIGVGIVSWGVLEAYRLVDVVNQTDLVERLDHSEKLGQPYVEAAWVPGDFSLRLYYLPYARGRTFPGAAGRPRSAAVVDVDRPMFETTLGPLQPSFAGRLAVEAGPVSLGLSGFSGVSREPVFVAQITDDSVVPRYDQLQQGGVDVQLTIDQLLIRSEAVTRWWSQNLRFAWAAAGGLELSFFDLGATGADLILVTEYYHDRRPLDAPVTLLDNDAFAGFRLLFNDTSDTQFGAGTVTDVESMVSFVTAQFGRRLGEHVSLELTARLFVGAEAGLASGLRGAHHAEARLAYGF